MHFQLFDPFKLLLDLKSGNQLLLRLMRGTNIIKNMDWYFLRDCLMFSSFQLKLKTKNFTDFFNKKTKNYTGECEIIFSKCF